MATDALGRLEGEKPYWRGTTLSAAYEFANPPSQ